MSIKKSLFPRNKFKSSVSWAFYDWASTAFGTVIITFVFSVYFAREIAVNETEGTAQWSFAIAASGLLIAILGPVLGSFADQTGRKKIWIIFFSLICVICSNVLWFATPGLEGSQILILLAIVALANLGLEMAQIFYNAMLPDLAPKNYLGRLSGIAWGLGYLGGLSALFILLISFIGLGDIKPLFNMPQDNAEHIRISGPFIGLWLLLFMIPLILYVPEKKQNRLGLKAAFQKGMSQLFQTIKNVKQFKNLVLFLISSAIYRDGLVTLFAVGGVYAATQFNMNFTDILIFAIGLNLSAGLGALCFAFINDKIGSKKTILISLFGLISFGIMILLIDDKNIFILLSLGLGIFVGPVQAASRAIVPKLVSETMITQTYGLYAFTGKSIAFLGPFMFGLATTIFETQQAGMMSIILFWFVGLLLMLKVREEQ
ncbi:MAG: MFS transporter [Pseudomonadota bacterium]